jgi:hypothetical protein
VAALLTLSFAAKPDVLTSEVTELAALAVKFPGGLNIRTPDTRARDKRRAAKKRDTFIRGLHKEVSGSYFSNQEEKCSNGMTALAGLSAYLDRTCVAVFECSPMTAK